MGKISFNVSKRVLAVKAALDRRNGRGFQCQPIVYSFQEPMLFSPIHEHGHQEDAVNENSKQRTS
jgi:hypothetical protein